MSERSAEVLIEDIQDALAKIIAYTHGMDEATFVENSLVADAVLRNFEVFGGAASKLPSEFLRVHPDIDWHKIIGMRNRLIHGYLGVSLRLVWQTIHVHLPDLQNRLNQL